MNDKLNQILPQSEPFEDIHEPAVVISSRTRKKIRTATEGDDMEGQTGQTVDVKEIRRQLDVETKKMEGLREKRDRLWKDFVATEKAMKETRVKFLNLTNDLMDEDMKTLKGSSNGKGK